MALTAQPTRAPTHSGAEVGPSEEAGPGGSREVGQSGGSDHTQEGGASGSREVGPSGGSDHTQEKGASGSREVGSSGGSDDTQERGARGSREGDDGEIAPSDDREIFPSGSHGVGPSDEGRNGLVDRSGENRKADLCDDIQDTSRILLLRPSLSKPLGPTSLSDVNIEVDQSRKGREVNPSEVRKIGDLEGLNGLVDRSGGKKAIDQSGKSLEIGLSESVDGRLDSDDKKPGTSSAKLGLSKSTRLLSKGIDRKDRLGDVGTENVFSNVFDGSHLHPKSIDDAGKDYIGRDGIGSDRIEVGNDKSFLGGLGVELDLRQDTRVLSKGIDKATKDGKSIESGMKEDAISVDLVSILSDRNTELKSDGVDDHCKDKFYDKTDVGESVQKRAGSKCEHVRGQSLESDDTLVPSDSSQNEDFSEGEYVYLIEFRRLDPQNTVQIDSSSEGESIEVKEISEEDSSEESDKHHWRNIDERTYENGDTNNNVVENVEDEKFRASANWNRSDVHERPQISLHHLTPDVDIKVEKSLLVGGNATSSGIEGDAENSDSDESKTEITDMIAKYGFKVPPSVIRRYSPLSRKSGTSDSVSERDSEILSLTIKRDLRLLKEDLPKKVVGKDTKHVREKRKSFGDLVPDRRDFSSSESTSAEDILPTSDKSEKHKSSSSEITATKGTVLGLNESVTSEGGLTSSDGSTIRSIVLPHQREIPIESKSAENIHERVKEREFSHITPLRQRSYKNALRSSDILSQSSHEHIPQHSITRSETVSSHVLMQNDQIITEAIDQTAPPPKKPFVRKLSYEMALKSGQLFVKLSPKSVKPNKRTFGALLSVKKLLQEKEKREAAIKDTKTATEENKQDKDNNAQTETINRSPSDECFGSNEATNTDSITRSGSSTTTEPQRFSCYEKILPLGGILTLVRGKPPSDGSESYTGSFHSLPWDATTNTEFPTAQSIDSLVSSTRTSSNSTPIEELIHIIKENVDDENLTLWMASVEDVLGLSKINTPTKDTEPEGEKKAKDIPFRSEKIDAKEAQKKSTENKDKLKKCNSETHRIPGLLEVIWLTYLQEYNFDIAEEKFTAFLIQCTQYAEYWRECAASKKPNLEWPDEPPIPPKPPFKPLPERDKKPEVKKELSEEVNKKVAEKIDKELDEGHPYDKMIKILSYKNILDMQERSYAIEGTNVASRFRLHGEVILLENDLVICKKCNAAPVSILWARQALARLDDKHVYANIPPFAENLTVIKRILAKLGSELLDKMTEVENDVYSYATASNIVRIYANDIKGLKRSKGSRRTLRKFIKGAIEVIPELDEIIQDGDDDDDETLSEDLHDPEKSSSNVKESTSKIEKNDDDDAWVSEESYNTTEVTEPTVKYQKRKKPEFEDTFVDVDKPSKSSNDDKMQLKKSAKTKKFLDQVLNRSKKRAKKNVSKFSIEDDQTTEPYVSDADQTGIDVDVELNPDNELAVSSRTREETVRLIRRKPYRAPWWKKWRYAKKRSKVPSVRFPSFPFSMNLIQHDNGRLEVVYGEEYEYPFAVGEYSPEDGRYLALEEVFLKKFRIYHPPNSYFFSVDGRNSNLTIMRFVRQSPSKKRMKMHFYFPPKYMFESTEEKGQCPNKKNNIQALQQWFSGKTYPASNIGDGYLIEKKSKKHRLPVPYFVPPIDSKEPPPKVGPKKLQKKIESQQQLAKVIPQDIYTTLIQLPVGLYIYSYPNKDNKVNNKYLQIMLREGFPPCISLQRVTGNQSLLTQVAKKYLSSQDSLNKVIIKIKGIMYGLNVIRYNLNTCPPTELTEANVSEYLEESSSSVCNNFGLEPSDETEADDIASQTDMTQTAECESKMGAMLEEKTAEHDSSESTTTEDPLPGHVCTFDDIEIEASSSEDSKVTFLNDPVSSHDLLKSYPSLTTLQSNQVSTVFELPQQSIVAKTDPDAETNLHLQTYRSKSYPSTSTHSPSQLFKSQENVECKYRPQNVRQSSLDYAHRPWCPLHIDRIHQHLKQMNTKCILAQQTHMYAQSDQTKGSLPAESPKTPSEMPEWYLPRLSRSDLRKKSLGSENVSEILSEIKEMPQPESIYEYPPAKRTMPEHLFLDKAPVTRRKSTGDTRPSYGQYLELPVPIQAIPTTSASQQLDESFAAEVNQRLMHMSDIRQRYPSQSEVAVPELSPSSYSLPYNLTDRCHLTGHSEPRFTAIDKPLHRHLTSQALPEWSRQPGMYPTASRHSLGTTDHPHQVQPGRQRHRSWTSSKVTYQESQTPIDTCHPKKLHSISKQSSLSASESGKEKRKTSSWSLGHVFPIKARTTAGTPVETPPPGQQQKIGKFAMKYRSLSTGSLGLMRGHSSTKYTMKSQIQHHVVKPKAARFSRSSEDIAKRIAHHYQYKESDSKLPVYKKDTKKTKRIIRKKHKERLSRSSEDIAERMAYHFITNEDEDTLNAPTIGSEFCPIHGHRPPYGSDLSIGTRRRSHPYLWCSTHGNVQEHRTEQPVIKKSPIWLPARKGRTKTV